MRVGIVIFFIGLLLTLQSSLAQQEENVSLCGNGICDPGEEVSCPEDCSSLTYEIETEKTQSKIFPKVISSEEGKSTKLYTLLAIIVGVVLIVFILKRKYSKKTNLESYWSENL
jgi:hypothetical protein